MHAETFQLLPVINNNVRTSLQYLYHRRSGLRINIYPLHQQAFTPRTGELHFYGKIFSWWMAFETHGYQNQPLALVKKGLRFYAECKLYPQMEVVGELPVKTNRYS
ncbi:hypothetical protein KHS38_03780 [Mucilaginibacter sp. Bleaf8]|uniref:hypothetical protein n=1 Tax=Mucilaginibacter sp. Bleaf8 TaxID=2834430 RepID=UPI001BD05793|nr:hypothetical protein [Mucilaginibacter sp. Bleaf8]MBS7563516.1 hypothetical protein [Mucilaginibacter sp. Bleaf8]